MVDMADASIDKRTGDLIEWGEPGLRKEFFNKTS